MRIFDGLGISVVIVVLLTGLSLHLLAENAAVDRRKAETIAKADRLFGQHYTAAPGKPLHLYDRETETGPPDAVIYSNAPSDCDTTPPDRASLPP